MKRRTFLASNEKFQVSVKLSKKDTAHLYAHTSQEVVVAEIKNLIHNNREFWMNDYLIPLDEIFSFYEEPKDTYSVKNAYLIDHCESTVNAIPFGRFIHEA